MNPSMKSNSAGTAATTARAVVADARRETVPSVNSSLVRRALGLAVGSLLVAGCFSLLLIIGRLPVFSEWVSDPLFFKRCLVLHVDLALIVWFFSFAAGLFALIPATASGHRAFRIGFGLSLTGVLAMVAGTMIPRTAPVLANYVPVIDNPVYVSGIALFFAGLAACFVNGRLFADPGEAEDGPVPSARNPFGITADTAIALRTCGLAYVTSMVTFLVSWTATPRGIDAKTYYELVFWGGGHVLQVANVSAMLAVWLYLLGSLLGRPVLSPRTARLLFGLLLLPHLASPLLTLDGTLGGTYRLGFTRLMQFGIAPVVLVVLAICLRRLREAWLDGGLDRRAWRDVRLSGFVASAALTITGFLLGSAIRGSNTMIPAHYHASIGAVTAAFMAVSYQLLGPLGFRTPVGWAARWLPWQPHLFGFGQVIFAVGFALGGMHGLGRKAYAAEQQLHTVGELVGVLVMGAGGLVAVFGGLLFLVLMVRAVLPRVSRSQPRTDPTPL
jgi:cytochrome c oxidase subunit I